MLYQLITLNTIKRLTSIIITNEMTSNQLLSATISQNNFKRTKKASRLRETNHHPSNY